MNAARWEHAVRWEHARTVVELNRVEKHRVPAYRGVRLFASPMIDQLTPAGLAGQAEWPTASRTRLPRTWSNRRRSCASTGGTLMSLSVIKT
jgi:hypothetical protein